MKNDERWAVRNIEERQAILNLYNNVKEIDKGRPQSSRPNGQLLGDNLTTAKTGDDGKANSQMAHYPIVNMKEGSHVPKQSRGFDSNPDEERFDFVNDYPDDE